MTSTDDLMERYEEKLRLIRYELSVDLPLSEEDMQEMERGLGGELPSDFRRFIARYNGLYTQAEIPVAHPVTTNPISMPPIVFGWMCFSPGEIKKNVETFKQAHWEESTMPRECFGFANGIEDRSPLCIVIQGEHRGEIRFLDYFVWSFDRGATRCGKPIGLPSVEDLPLIASSFEEFFFRLQPMSDDE